MSRETGAVSYLICCFVLGSLREKVLLLDNKLFIQSQVIQMLDECSNYNGKETKVKDTPHSTDPALFV